MDSLQQFSRHVPQILRHQILLDLVKEYLRYDSGVGPVLNRGPSMQRFKGALLFIDISGFTVLSQKLDIESLKNNINDYFTKMLTIIQKWGGDVVKFAGDALYIVWQVRDSHNETEVSDPRATLQREESRALDSISDIIGAPRIMTCRDAVERATSCALEICATCGNYEVKLQQAPERRGSINAFQYKSASAGDATDDVTYLDVHAGLSYGTMAGIDIGAENRWEYFLAGSPLADVAAAEEKAKKGDVVVCKEAHQLWHGSEDHIIDEDGKLTCGCRLFEESFYFVSKSDATPTVPTQTLRRKSSRARLMRKEGMKDILTHGTRMHEDLAAEIELIYEKIRPMLELIYTKIVLDDSESLDDKSLGQLRSDFEEFYEIEGRRRFSTWMIKAMTDELAKHVHDVERKNHPFHEPYLRERYYEAVHHWCLSDRSRSESHTMIPEFESQRSFNTADQTTRELGVDLQSMLTETRLQKSQYHNVFTGSTSVAAEIFLHSSEKRSLVTVMFVKIESITIEIHEHEGKRDHHDDHHLETLLGFIPRSVQEYEEDVAALDRLQRCYVVLHEAIYSTEGQLRQFIIDDKGTVCIATFGLMGSVSVDNAASAIACAEKIILGLEGIDLNARIGVTTGEAYCGVVGSSIRHEYAVMGPSTNLSARLMCRAEARSIICDETTYGQDRANKFILLDELKDVKGYSHPVKIFQPRSSVDLLNSNLIHDVQGKSNKTVRSAIITSKFVKGVYNVMKKVKKNVLFAAKISKSRAKIRSIYDSTFEFLCEDRLKTPIKNEKNRRVAAFEKKVEVYRTLHGRYHTIKTVFESIIPSFGTIQNVIFEIDSMCRMVVVGSSVGGGKSAILSAISLKLQKASENDAQLNFFLVSDNTFSKLRLKATVPLSYWGFILFDLLKIVATNFQMTLDTTLTPQEQSRLRYLHTFDSLMQQLPENLQDARHRHLLLRLMKLDNSLGRTAEPSAPSPNGLTTMDSLTAVNTAANASSSSTPSNNPSNHHFNRAELDILLEMIVHFVDLIPKIMNCAMILVLDDAHFLDSWSLRALHEVWQRVKGVCMILSFNPTQYHSTNMGNDHNSLTQQDSFMYSSSNSLPRKSSMVMNKSINAHSSDIFAEYAGSDRFNYLELPSLQLEDTKFIAADILGPTMELNEAEIQQLYDISNGNPLYTVELMYAILANEGRVDQPTVYTRTSKSLSTFSYDANGNVISTPTARSRDFRVYFNKSKRLEEVIYYKLDQLHAHAQVLLKAASVAVSNGRTFTLELIYFMLDQNELFPSSGPVMMRQTSVTSSLTSTTIVDDDEDEYDNATANDALTAEEDSNHLAEQIIPFLIHYKIFIRVAKPRVQSSSASGIPNTPTAAPSTQTYALHPPRASRLMQEQCRLSQEERKQRQQHKAALERGRSQESSRRSQHFDFDSVANVTVDEYEEDDGDDDVVPDSVRGNKRGDQRKAEDKADASTPSAPKTVVFYEFIAPIEQSTIYGLITDDQRKYFHERVASFYRESLLDIEAEAEEDEIVQVDLDLPPLPPTRSQNPSVPPALLGGFSRERTNSSVTFHPTVEHAPSPVPHDPLVTPGSNIDDLWILPGEDNAPSKMIKLKIAEGESPENLLEEAFHWEKANFLSTALRTYMRCAELEKQRENESGWISSLQHALRVYKTIEQEYNQGELPLMPNQKLPYPELIIKILLGQNTKDTDVVLYLKSIEKDMTHVWEIFEHDMDLIPLVCSLHLALADAYLLSWGTLGEIATMAGVALKLMLFLRYQDLFSFSSPGIHRRRNSHGGGPGFDHHSSHRNLHGSHYSLPHFHSVTSMVSATNPSTPHGIAGISPSMMPQTMNVSFNYKDLFQTRSFRADPHHLISTLHIIHNTVMRYERPDDRDGTYYYYIAFKMGELIVDVNDETQNICLKAMKGLRGKDYLKVAETIAPLLADPPALITAKSAMRVQRFGVDLLPSIVSELAQSFFLTQEKHRFHELLEKPLYDTLLRLPHLPSVENSLLSLMVLLTYSEDFRLYRKMRSACKSMFVDRRDQLVLIQGKFQEVVQCWARSFLALYSLEDVSIPQRDRITLSGITTGMEIVEALFESVQPGTDSEDREMTNVEVKSLLRYGATMESLALQMVCGLMLFVPKDGEETTLPSQDGIPPTSSPSKAAAGLHAIQESEHEHEMDSESTSAKVVSTSTKNIGGSGSSFHALPTPNKSEEGIVPDRTSMMSRDNSFQSNSITEIEIPPLPFANVVVVEPPSAAHVDELFSRWWDRMFTDLYTLRYLHILNILNPLLLLCRLLTQHQPHLVLPNSEARILLFYARFKTEIIHVCKKHKYLVAMEKFIAVENIFVERRKDRGGRVRTMSSPCASDSNSNSDNFVSVQALGVSSLDADNQGNAPSASPTAHNSSMGNLLDATAARASMQPRRLLNRRTFTPRSLQEIIRTVERKQPVASNSPPPPPGGVNPIVPTPVSSASSPTRGLPGGRPGLNRSGSSSWRKMQDALASSAEPDSEGKS